MPEFVVWPHKILTPRSIQPNVVAFTRSGGTTLGGLQRVTRTDRGSWEIALKGIPLYTVQQRRLWNALRTHAGGMAGLFAVPAWSFDTAPWPADSSEGLYLTDHSDGSTFSDGSGYTQQAIGVQMAEAAALGATSVKLRLLFGIEELSGVRFSYQHALYETGVPTLIEDDEWTVPVTPAIRAPIPTDAELEFALPTCLARLASDREMDVSFSAGRFDQVDVAFVEAADYWNDLAEDT